MLCELHLQKPCLLLISRRILYTGICIEHQSLHLHYIVPLRSHDILLFHGRFGKGREGCGSLHYGRVEDPMICLVPQHNDAAYRDAEVTTVYVTAFLQAGGLP